MGVLIAEIALVAAAAALLTGATGTLAMLIVMLGLGLVFVGARSRFG